MSRPDLETLLRQNLTLTGDGNVVGNDDTVTVTRQSAGDYAIQIGELRLTLSPDELHRILAPTQVTITDSQVGVVGDHAHIEGGVHFHEAVPPPPPSPPFMVESLQDFVDRPDEFERLIGHLLDRDRDTPACDEPRRIVVITAALRGAGGYGKTMPARTICHDERIRRAFPDGILWVTLGQTPDVLGGLLKLYAALTGQRPAFVDVEDAANALAAQLGDRDCLMVVDDVWHPVHLRPFLSGGERCARLITTRDGTTLPSDARTRTVNVDAMRQDKAIALLGATLPPADEGDLRSLAAKALGQIGDAHAVEPLVAALQDKDSDVRLKAAEALGRIGDAHAVEPLSAALRDEDRYWSRQYNVQKAAAGVLKKICTPEALPALEQW